MIEKVVRTHNSDHFFLLNREKKEIHSHSEVRKKIVPRTKLNLKILTYPIIKQHNP